ncbi:SDR family oxidoreductase [Mucilaginibacter robiniae]|uniref:SDR family oxidoreductase n=1 Tax=Mucilaginibacter robiniae TaxID=2728022 RepID=A0A7L5E4V4_9SPHI|nr:SDR family oxidoreductase [Mucilaginibacter robiniae]QJD96774.1 SDR family oxidoreductase [Mucilaginibacter robiniae]
MSNINKYALITGGTSGIGYELAKVFARDGYSLVIVSRSDERLEEVAREFEQMFNIEVKTIAKDLFKPGAAKEVHEQTAQWGITINALVNNAGQAEFGKFVDTDLDRDIDLVHLDVIALMSLTKFYLKEMVARNEGKILNLASSLSKAPTPMMAVYAASKAFVLSFTEALIQEVKDTNVTLTALMPNATDTDFFHKAKALDSMAYKKLTFYSPQEVAEAAYEGLQAGTDKVVPGIINKINMVTNDLLPDKAVAAMTNMMTAHSESGKQYTEHTASAEERAAINNKTGGTQGDYNSHEGHVHED